ncbi:MAG: alanine--tRNA ligase-related protein [Alphaproteobacteria bacterium]|nr:alanine--tRNA ligase-related protein [Alphaproteobacteria bacterium]
MQAKDFSDSCARIRDAFIQSFQDAQFVNFGVKPLVPEADQSVIFVGASISAFKPFLTNQLVFNQKFDNMVLVQPCLRLHNLNNLLKTPVLQYYSYFNMLGALCQPSAEKLTIDALVRFVGQIMTKGIIRASRQETPYYSIFNNAFSIELDTRPPEYYSWIFGTKEYIGKGVTLALSNHNKNFWQFSVKDISKPGAAALPENFGTGFQDVGNLIRLYDHSGRHIASEIGLGIETIHQAQSNCASQVESYAYKSILEKVCSNASDHFVDSAVTSTIIVQAGVRDENSKRGQLLNKAVRNTVYTGLIEGMNLDQITRSTDTLNQFLGGSPSNAEDVRKIVEKQYYAAIKNITNLGRVLSSPPSSGRDEHSRKKLVKKVMNLADGEYYIPDVVRDHLLSQKGLVDPSQNGATPYRPLDRLFQFIQSNPAPIMC